MAFTAKARNIACIFLLAAMLCGLCGCGKDADDTAVQNSNEIKQRI